MFKAECVTTNTLNYSSGAEFNNFLSKLATLRPTVDCKDEVAIWQGSSHLVAVISCCQLSLIPDQKWRLNGALNVDWMQENLKVMAGSAGR